MAGRYSDYIFYDGTMVPVANTDVTVCLMDTTTLATLYDSTMTEIANPTKTDANGHLDFYVTAGDYDIYLYGTKWATVAVNELTDTNPLALSGDIVCTGVGARFKADFSNNTKADRLMFQTTGTDTFTVVGAIPSGTNNVCAFRAYNSTDPDNSSYVEIHTEVDKVSLISGIFGTGNYLPIDFSVNGARQMRLTASGTTATGTSNLLVGSTVDDGSGNRLQVTGGVALTGLTYSALSTAPASAAATGVTGEVRVTADYIYVCTATNTWKRAALSTW